jgi:excinuclease ABC subunit C
MVKSILDDIEGIGEVRRKALLKHFGSTDKITEASINELKEVEGMNQRAAEAVYGFFHKENL